MKYINKETISILFILNIFLIIYAGFLLNFSQNFNNFNLIEIILALIWVISFLVIFFQQKKVLSLYSAFFLIFGLFHLGIPISNILGYESLYFKQYIQTWYNGLYGYQALNGILYFIFGYFVVIFFKTLNYEKKDLSFTSSLLFNTFILCVFIWIFFTKVYYSVSNYDEYAIGVSNNILSFIFIYLNNIIGFLLFLNGFNNSYQKKSLYIFLIWSIFAFPIGLRGEVLIPFIIFLVVIVNKEIIKLNLLKISIICFLILLSSSYVFVNRGSESIDDISISPLATIQEMGGTLRPVVEVVRWIDTQELPLQLGATYWAPLERLLTKFIPYTERLPATEDFRLMNVAIFEKAGPYGFSVVAEALINFSFIGAALIGMLIGYFLRNIDKNGFNYFTLPLIFALFFHIRQSFVGSFGVFLIGLITILIFFFLIDFKSKKNEY